MGNKNVSGNTQGEDSSSCDSTGTKNDLSNQVQTDNQITEQLKEQKKKNDGEVKILFFGLAGSGRSTIINKIKAYNAGQESAAQETINKGFKEIIQFHTLQSIQQLIQASEILDIPLWNRKELANTQYSDKKLRECVDELKQVHFSFNEVKLTPELGENIHSLWSQKGAKQVFESRSDERLLHLKDIATANYFLDNVKRISSLDFCPSDEDVKFYHEKFNEECRGIEEISFEFSGQKYRIFNVEGQNNERRKWLHHFECVDIICFLCPIGDYDLPPSQQGRQNIVLESLQLFKRMCNTKFFSETPVILLLTKYDTFVEKIEETDMICCFKDYTGGCVNEHALKFLTEKFLNVRSKKSKFGENLDENDDGFLNFSNIGIGSTGSGAGGSVASTSDLDEGHGQIYIHFISFSHSVKDIVFNFGGTLKNVLYLKKQEERILRMKKRGPSVIRNASSTSSNNPTGPPLANSNNISTSSPSNNSSNYQQSLNDSNNNNTQNINMNGSSLNSNNNASLSHAFKGLTRKFSLRFSNPPSNQQEQKQ